jgi:hypothetical protein
MVARKLFGLYLLSLLGLASVAGCKKDDPTTGTPPVVAPSAGSATGIISPAGAVLTVTATSSTGATYTATPAAGTGAFAFGSLPAGSYSLTFTAATGFVAPAAQPLVVASNAATTIAPVNVAAATGSVALQFDAVVGTAPLVLANQLYTRANGQQMRVTRFAYYCSNIRLSRADGSSFAVPNSYYLVTADAPVSQSITISGVPVGEYTGLSFMVGVDSVRNVSGAQTGALDPVNGMFWTWNSGYIFMKMEGTSPQAPHVPTVPEGSLIFHIGGFQRPNNAIRTVSPLFAGTRLLVRDGHMPQVQYQVDVAKMFDGLNTVNFSSLNNVMGGTGVVPIADNYAAGMFRVARITAN